MGTTQYDKIVERNNARKLQEKRDKWESGNSIAASEAKKAKAAEEAKKKTEAKIAQQKNWDKGIQNYKAEEETKKAQQNKTDHWKDGVGIAESEAKKTEAAKKADQKYREEKDPYKQNTSTPQKSTSSNTQTQTNKNKATNTTPAVSVPNMATSTVATVTPVVASVASANGVTYWYSNKGDIPLKIAAIQLSSSVLMASVKNLAEVVKEYVNVSGKWNDENAKVFAKWWNSGTSLTIATNSTTKNIWLQGTEEIGIQGILNRCAQLFHIVICRQLYAVINKKFTKKKQEFSDYLYNLFYLGSDVLYNNATVENNENNNTTWANLMSEISKQEPVYWQKDFAVPEENATTGGSNDAELANFCSKFLENFNIVFDNLKTVLKNINTIANDENAKAYFGFSPNTNMKYAAKQLNGYIESSLTDITSLLNTILEFTKTNVDETIKEYNQTNYNLE